MGWMLCVGALYIRVCVENWSCREDCLYGRRQSFTRMHLCSTLLFQPYEVFFLFMKPVASILC